MKEPSNIAELFNYYIDKKVPATKLYDVKKEYILKIAEETGINPKDVKVQFVDMKQYFRKRFGG